MKNVSLIDTYIVSFLQSLDKGRFSSKEKILFFKQLSYLLKGGVSLVDAMNILIDSTDNFAIKDIAKTILEFIKKGKPLSYALNRLPDYFDEGDFSIIKTGEVSGNLPLVLASLASEYVYVKDIKDKYIGAMIYPIILLLVSFIAVISLFAFVLPAVFSIADSFQWMHLPFLTQLLRDFSLFLKLHWQSIGRSFLGIGSFLWIFFSTDIGKKFWFNLVLSIPLLGRMTKYYYVVKFCRYMKLMLSSGMNYVETFQLLRDILGVPAYQNMLENVLAGLQRWENIYDHLKFETNLLPSDVPAMIKVGEQTANLQNTLDNILSMYDSELTILISRLSKVIEPIMLVFIGWIVVVIAFAVFGLILQIMDWVGV